MSGPIVRKYGFPNFEEIFGKRDLEHGVEETPTETPLVSAEAGTTVEKAKAKPKALKKKSS